MSNARILVVDDNADFRELIRFALERAGYEVCEADNGLRALTVIEEAHPDLVLVDVNMPVMSGPQFIEELRKRGEVRPFGVVAISGSVSARGSPTKWFLSKPIQIDLLLGVVADFCGRRGTSALWVREQQRDTLDVFDKTLRAAV